MSFQILMLPFVHSSSFSFFFQSAYLNETLYRQTRTVFQHMTFLITLRDLKAEYYLFVWHRYASTAALLHQLFNFQELPLGWTQVEFFDLWKLKRLKKACFLKESNGPHYFLPLLPTTFSSDWNFNFLISGYYYYNQPGWKTDTHFSITWHHDVSLKHSSIWNGLNIVSLIFFTYLLFAHSFIVIFIIIGSFFVITKLKVTQSLRLGTNDQICRHF